MLELLLVLLLVLLNGFFAMSELAVITARKGRLKKAAENSRGARQALKLAEHPERFLSAVQVWITLLGLLTGYVGGETLAGPLSAWLAQWPAIADFAPEIAFALCFGVILLVSVVLGELVPKRLGTLRPESIAAKVALPMQFLSWLATPVVDLLTASTKLLLRLPGLRGLAAETVGAEDIRSLVAESHEQGEIDADERNMLNRVLRLGDRSAESLMTSRTRIAWLDARDSARELVAAMREGGYSRYPVYRGSDSDVLGVLELRRLVGLDTGDREAMLAQMQPVLFVPDSTSALRLLETLREEQRHLALVVDEYGEIQGLVTLHDLLGAVMGRLEAGEAEIEEAMVIERDDGSWLVDGRLPVDELRELLSLSTLPLEDQHDYLTAAGMVIAHYGRIPSAGEHFDWQGWRIEVVDLDGVRIDKLLIERELSADAPRRERGTPSA